MRGIHRDDENATAICYRMAEDRTVPARSGDPGAIVTPIVTPEGCIGVLAAEVSEGTEANADRRALAGILAAQLSTLVTTLPAQSEALQAQG
jgi:GAF domain-containing protein